MRNHQHGTKIASHDKKVATNSNMRNIPGFLLDVSVTPSSLTSYHLSTFLLASSEAGKGGLSPMRLAH